jgi:uncharacterized membrane protein
LGAILTVILLVLPLLGALAAPAGAADTVGGPPAAQAVDPDTVLLNVSLQPEGDAHWTVAYRVKLETESDEAAFSSLQADVRNNSTAFTSEFARRMATTARTAENATGREMAIENVTVAATTQAIPQQYGVLTYRFRWTNFAVRDGTTLTAGDAIANLFLDNETALQMIWPAEFHLQEANPEPDSLDERRVVWTGARDFGPGEPRVVLSTATPTPAGPDDGGLPVVAATAVVAALLAGGVVLFARRLGLLGGGPTPGEAAGPGPAGGAAADAETEAEAGAEAEGATEAGAGGATAGEEGTPSELLSNEERVLALLEQEGGRLKQQQVAERLAWTDAKTSQVVGDLREADEVETFRLGRENVVTLPDEGLDTDV